MLLAPGSLTHGPLFFTTTGHYQALYPISLVLLHHPCSTTTSLPSEEPHGCHRLLLPSGEPLCCSHPLTFDRPSMTWPRILAPLCFPSLLINLTPTAPPPMPLSHLRSTTHLHSSQSSILQHHPSPCLQRCPCCHHRLDVPTSMPSATNEPTMASPAAIQTSKNRPPVPPSLRFREDPFCMT